MNIIVTKEQAKFILESKNSDVDERSRSFAFTRKRRLFSKGEMMANPDRYKYYDKKQKHVLETGEIDETRSSYLSFIVNKVKDITGEEWPEYVLKDWLYKNTKSYDPGMDTRVGYKKLVYRFVRDFTNEYGQGHWVHKVVTLGFDSFTQDTKKGIQSRHGGRVPVPGIHNDIERHRIQNNLIQKRGVSNEPIILVQRTDGYDLLEGWHRTIQSLENFKTYEQPAYIYVPN